MIAPEELAERMKAEILEDISFGRVPRSVKNFAELHNYVDANCYGGTEEILARLDAKGSGSDESETTVLNALIDVMNSAMEIINVWLAEGGALRGFGDRER